MTREEEGTTTVKLGGGWDQRGLSKGDDAELSFEGKIRFN